MEHKSYSPIKEIPQNPEIPWNKWIDNLRNKFKKMSIDPKQRENPLKDIPFEFMDKIIEENKIIRNIMGEKSRGVFYRPGLGYGGAISEIVSKIGSYETMIVTDPVYIEKGILKEFSAALLPIDYFTKSLSTIDAKDIVVNLNGEILDKNTYETTEIPKDGTVSIDFKINGVNLKIQLLTQDMTKFYPNEFNILSIRQPSPPNDNSNTKDPRDDKDFKPKIIQKLSKNGIIVYNESSWYFIPPDSTPAEFGLKKVWSKNNTIILQK